LTSDYKNKNNMHLVFKLDYLAPKTKKIDFKMKPFKSEIISQNRDYSTQQQLKITQNRMQTGANSKSPKQQINRRQMKITRANL
jgi:hypothetical protein